MPRLTDQEITDKVLEGSFGGRQTARSSVGDMFKPIRPEHDSLAPRPKPRDKKPKHK